MTLPIIFGNENAKNQVEPTKFCQNKQQSSYIFATMEITVTVQNMQNYATLQKRCVFLRLLCLIMTWFTHAFKKCSMKYNGQTTVEF